MAEGGVFSALDPLFAFLSYALVQADSVFYDISDFNVITPDLNSSHQDDLAALSSKFPWHSMPFAPFNPVPAQITAKSTLFTSLKDTGAPRCPDPITPEEQADLASVPVALNLASYNFTGFAGNKLSKCARLRPSGNMVSAPVAGPPGVYVYGSIDAHMDLERDIADFLSTETAILHSQGFSTIPCAISAFTKRGDIIVANRAINFAVQKGFQISRSTVRWFEHNGLKFIATEGIFEKDGAMVNLPKLIELKLKYKYHLILDECISLARGPNCTFGRERLELVRRILRWLAYRRRSPAHQRNLILSTLQENVRAIRAVLDRVEAITIPTPPRRSSISPAICSTVAVCDLEGPEPKTPAPREAPSFDIASEERTLQDIVDEVLAQGVDHACAPPPRAGAR
ncbi:Pyridoxal phosphate-dependent transferase [Lactarius tabidus]